MNRRIWFAWLSQCIFALLVLPAWGSDRCWLAARNCSAAGKCIGLWAGAHQTAAHFALSKPRTVIGAKIRQHAVIHTPSAAPTTAPSRSPECRHTSKAPPMTPERQRPAPLRLPALASCRGKRIKGNFAAAAAMVLTECVNATKSSVHCGTNSICRRSDLCTRNPPTASALVPASGSLMTHL